MRYVSPLVMLVVPFLVAWGNGDGGGRPASPSPESTGTAPPSTSMQAAAGCSGPLPAGPVAFRGTVLSFDTAPFVEPGSKYYRVIAQVEIQDVEVQEGASEYKFKFQPGEIAEVVLLGDGWPSVQAGDCVLVSGANHRYACGGGCDAAGFVAEVFEAYPASPAPGD